MKKSIEVAKLLKQGRTDYKDIAKQIGCDLSLVYQMKKRMFPETKRKYTKRKRKTVKKVSDMVNSPAHYTKGGIETYDFIRAKKLSYELGNVVKYVTRAGHKGSRLEDLKKAQWYLAAAIKQEERA